MCWAGFAFLSTKLLRTVHRTHLHTLHQVLQMSRSLRTPQVVALLAPIHQVEEVVERFRSRTTAALMLAQDWELVPDPVRVATVHRLRACPSLTLVDSVIARVSLLEHCLFFFFFKKKEEIVLWIQSLIPCLLVPGTDMRIEFGKAFAGREPADIAYEPVNMTIHTHGAALSKSNPFPRVVASRLEKEIRLINHILSFRYAYHHAM